jgi:hypothetical protein
MRDAQPERAGDEGQGHKVLGVVGKLLAQCRVEGEHRGVSVWGGLGDRNRGGHTTGSGPIFDDEGLGNRSANVCASTQAQ